MLFLIRKDYCAAVKLSRMTQFIWHLQKESSFRRSLCIKDNSFYTAINELTYRNERYIIKTYCLINRRNL